MKKKIKFILLYFLAAPTSFLIVAFTLFMIFQYTLVADIRESLTEVNEHDPLAYGKVLFETRNCSGCHSIVLGQKNIGPNLFGLSQSAPAEYIRQSIADPNAVISPGFPPDRMPIFGEILDENQIDALVVYVQSMK